MKLNENEMNFSVPLEIIKASEIEPKEVKWLWYPYIPLVNLFSLHVYELILVTTKPKFEL